MRRYTMIFPAPPKKNGIDDDFSHPYLFIFNRLQKKGEVLNFSEPFFIINVVCSPITQPGWTDLKKNFLFEWAYFTGYTGPRINVIEIGSAGLEFDFTD